MADKTEKKPAPKTASAAREERRAMALKANLRRRKAAAPSDKDDD